MKRLINHNLKTLLEECIKNSDIECNQYTLRSYENIGVGAICISRNNDSYHLHLNSEISKQYVLTWKRGVGGIITRMFKHKRYDNFYEIRFNNYKVLAYKPDDYDSLVSELDADGNNKVDVNELDVVEIGDFKYIIVHTSLKNGWFSNTYADSDDDYFSTELNIVEIDEEIKREQEESEELESISLF